MKPALESAKFLGKKESKIKERVKEIGFTVAVLALLLIGELHL
jgi:hypothetical protein